MNISRDLSAEMLYFESKIWQIKEENGELKAKDFIEVIEAVSFKLTDVEKEECLRELEGQFEVTHTEAISIHENYQPWLAARRKGQETDWFYSKRLEKFHRHKKKLTSYDISVLDKDTEKTLDYCGDPLEENAFLRRGMVIGNVQMGKTTNYAMLMAKAADAGYKIIILLTGLTNTLRVQGQERINQELGIKSHQLGVANEILEIERFNPNYSINRWPIAMTTISQDLNKRALNAVNIQVAATTEPWIFVTKKNPRVLEQLYETLKDRIVREEQPLMLIDDEADNASVNTSKDPQKATKINESIRKLLKVSDKTSYVAYTATPFANIFIDPFDTEKMFNDDLFPRNFISVLDAPKKYVGAYRVFNPEGNLYNNMVRLVDDFGDLLPLKHKKDLEIEYLPESLKKAIRVFCLTRAIRVLRDQGSEHCTMMVNVSRFNDVQDKVHGKIFDYLTNIKESIDVNSRLDQSKHNDGNLIELQKTFDEEFAHLDYSFEKLQTKLYEAVCNIETVTVNMRTAKDGGLNYSDRRYKKLGKQVIAIGGLALSRGLTLEHLTTSYILRNTAASDTLMQMARWFGYRSGYEDICRVYLHKDSLRHYQYIERATAELVGEIQEMNSQSETPKTFGLAVRQSETGILITAKNKMRAAESMRIAKTFAGKLIQGALLHNDSKKRDLNLDLTIKFVNQLGGIKSHPHGKIITNVPSEQVMSFIDNFDFPMEDTSLGKIFTTNRSLLYDFLDDPKFRNRFSEWDIVIPHNQTKSNSKTNHLEMQGKEIFPMGRSGSFDDKIFRAGKEKLNLSEDKHMHMPFTETELEKIGDEKDYLKRTKALTGRRLYCSFLKRPVLYVYLFNIIENPDEGLNKIPGLNVSLCFALPSVDYKPEEKTYAINPVYKKQLILNFENEEDDDENEE